MASTCTTQIIRKNIMGCTHSHSSSIAAVAGSSRTGFTLLDDDDTTRSTSSFRALYDSLGSEDSLSELHESASEVSYHHDEAPEQEFGGVEQPAVGEAPDFWERRSFRVICNSLNSEDSLSGCYESAKEVIGDKDGAAPVSEGQPALEEEEAAEEQGEIGILLAKIKTAKSTLIRDEEISADVEEEEEEENESDHEENYLDSDKSVAGSSMYSDQNDEQSFQATESSEETFVSNFSKLLERSVAVSSDKVSEADQNESYHFQSATINELLSQVENETIAGKEESDSKIYENQNDQVSVLQVHVKDTIGNTSSLVDHQIALNSNQSPSLNQDPQPSQRLEMASKSFEKVLVVKEKEIEFDPKVQKVQPGAFVVKAKVDANISKEISTSVNKLSDKHHPSQFAENVLSVSPQVAT